MIKNSPRQPAGSVLLFTLVILVLLALMGFSLMTNTRTELTVSHNTIQGRDAFKKADLTARLALFVGRVLLNGFGEPGEMLDTEGRPPRWPDKGAAQPGFVILPAAGLSLQNILQTGALPTTDDILDRYRQATASDTAALPHISVIYGDQVVGTAALAIYFSDEPAPGASGGEGGYGTQGENSISVYLVVSANGRLPQGSEAGDSANYFEGGPATHSIVTAVFREIVVN